MHRKVGGGGKAELPVSQSLVPTGPLCHICLVKTPLRPVLLYQGLSGGSQIPTLRQTLECVSLADKFCED